MKKNELINLANKYYFKYKLASIETTNLDLIKTYYDEFKIFRMLKPEYINKKIIDYYREILEMTDSYYEEKNKEMFNDFFVQLQAMLEILIPMQFPAINIFEHSALECWANLKARLALNEEMGKKILQDKNKLKKLYNIFDDRNKDKQLINDFKEFSKIVGETFISLYKNLNLSEELDMQYVDSFFGPMGRLKYYLISIRPAPSPVNQEYKEKLLMLI